ncbi:MAG: hypothetical protein ACFBWO_00820 [Paracoccaceae bacterium]
MRADAALREEAARTVRAAMTELDAAIAAPAALEEAARDGASWDGEALPETRTGAEAGPDAPPTQEEAAPNAALDGHAAADGDGPAPARDGAPDVETKPSPDGEAEPPSGDAETTRAASQAASREAGG